MRIVIVGGGTAGWMAANLFAKKLPKHAHITLVESPDVGIIGVGEGSTPTLKRFFEMMDIADSEWMPRCNATYKTNIRFLGWSPKSGVKDYSHPFISQLDTFTERAFHVNCQTRRLGLDTTVTPEKFLLNGVLANQGKAPIVPEHFPFRMEYGYHFDSHLLGEFLSEVAQKQGVTYRSATVTNVALNENGDIASLATDKGNIEGEWFVDCSGFRGRLIKQALGVGFKSFKSNLFNDAAVVIPTAAQQQLPVETHAVALSHGWCWHIPLQHRTGNGYVYSSDFVDSEQAEMTLRQHLGVDESIEARHLKMQVGRLESQWCNNTVAFGLSQGFIEPLEATALHLVQVSIELFLSLFNKGEYSREFQSEYNQKIKIRFERVRDYIVAHYKLNTRDDTEYWRANRKNENLSESLTLLLQAWFQREDLGKEIERQQLDTHFGTTSWHCLLSGYGAFPKLAANQPGQGDLYKEQDIASFLGRCALNFPSHAKSLC